MTILLSVLDIPIDLTFNKNVCQLCFDIIDEIDAFEHNLTLAKDKLKEKHHKLTFNLTENNSFFIDRLLKSPASAQNTDSEDGILEELKTDLWALNHETPENIECSKTSETWTISLLRSETEDMDLNVAGELYCFHCSQEFNSVQERIFHVQSPVTCRCCNETKFPDETTAWHHTCQSQDPTTTSSNKLEIVRKPHFMQNSFQCQNCKLSFDKEVIYWMHFYQRHPKYSKMNLCYICQFPVPDALAFRRHFLIEHYAHFYQCPHCQMEFKNSDQIETHLESHEKDKEEDFQEEEMPILVKKSYISKSFARSLRRDEPLSKLEHFKANMDIGLYPPPDPSKIITSFNQVPEDIRDECLKTIDLLRTMPYQIQTFDAQNDWDLVMLKCQVSNLSFGIPGESHCFECQKNFNSVQDRIQHNLTSHHADCKSFKCSSCKNQIFHDNSQLVKHLRKRHADDLTIFADKIWTDFDYCQEDGWLKCQLCPGAFQSEIAFYAHHLESHKPSQSCLQCTVCGKVSANIMEFKRHVLMIHGGFTHVCIVCGKRYG